MAWLMRLLKYIGLLGVPQLRPGTIEGLPPFAVRQTVESLLRSGWIKTFEYIADDAWVDYARIDLRKGCSKLKLEWDLDSGGSVAGPRAVLHELRVLDPWTQLQARHW